MPNKIKTRKELKRLEEELTRSSRFSRHQVKCLLEIFYQLCSSKELKMERQRFRDVMHKEFSITDDIILDRIFRAFDKDSDAKISAEEWVKGLSVFLRGSLEEKLKFCFIVYDMNMDGWISKDEMFHFLKYTLPNKHQEEDPDEGVRDLMEQAFKKLDEDGDNRVSFDDYSKAVEKDGLTMEFLGDCLPSDDARLKYENSVFGNQC